MRIGIICSLIFLLITGTFYAQEIYNNNKFKQLKQELATPNVYRTASGAPGQFYYQNTADYAMNITLVDEQQRIYGEETITYTNASPDPLEYLWLQLDQNMRAKDSDTKKIETNNVDGGVSFGELKRMLSDFDGGFKIEYVKNTDDTPLDYTINKTMMRIDLPKTLKPNASFSFKIKWWYNINNRKEIGGRSGYEYFEKEDNYLYTIAQFFPRMCVYNDVEGWQNKQFLGRGEFTLPFGNYKVSITVPSDHVVAATGELQNKEEVLTKKQLERLEQAKKSEKEPVFIITEKEAVANEKTKDKGLKTWTFKAEYVRDFAFASSRKFIWDAMVVKQKSHDVLAMSFYPKEGNPLWEKYSTKVVAHTLKTYTKYTVDYPYPVAISVHTDQIGMEYPMICFNGGRPEPDGTYSERTKYGMISVIIHEVGHNYFPMIINSDERQWTWMDEGLNTFCQYLTEQEWERDYPSRRGPAYKIVDYMKGDKKYISPIMTNSESIWQFGNNAYGKPATALNILRETIMGRELFDYAFKTYANRWKFKHPTPADFFRTMEDASAVDLDWFWRGWFFTTDHVDISLDEIKAFRIDTKNPVVEKAWDKAQENKQPEFIGDIRNKETIKKTVTEEDPKLEDFYTTYDPYSVSGFDKEKYENYLKDLTDEEKQLLATKLNFYQIKFSNIGGLVMPIILEFTFKDGSKEEVRIPAEIWKQNNEEVTKVFFFEKEVVAVQLDPHLETADTDTYNNSWPRKMEQSKFELFKQKSYPNEMQRSKKK
ncbi:MAG: M1 family metallopeptidase [Vicingaceae bacterium]